MGKGIDEADRGVDFQQDIGDARGRHSTIEIENQFLCIFGNVGSQPVDPQRSIFDAAMGDGPIASRTRQPLQAVREAGFAIGQPSLRIERNSQLGICLRRCHRYKDLLQITVATRMIQPYVAGSESVPEMKQNRDLPQTIIALVLRSEMAMPFRIGP
ncbi:hypothetical protein EV291_115143 [Rhizobium sp. BK068]|nr:hypothetical protein EV291_115143 [Rhizobium sp. BK068]